MKELLVKFDSLSNDQKILFIKEIMPGVCSLFAENPNTMMAICKDMKKNCNIDMSQMMSMMEEK